MVQKLAASAAFAVLFVALAAGGAAAKGKDKKKSGGAAVPDAVSRQLQWEDKVVGPKEKGVDHKKIAAMQEQGRREDAAKLNEPPPQKSRAHGVSAPATATLPTMDIEKPAPAGSARKPAAKAPRAEAAPPRQKDAIDSILSEDAAPAQPTASGHSGRAGLNNVLASDERTSPPRPQRAKKARRKHR
jgi:hypothetical protein